MQSILGWPRSAKVTRRPFDIGFVAGPRIPLSVPIGRECLLGNAETLVAIPKASATSVAGRLPVLKVSSRDREATC